MDAILRLQVQILLPQPERAVRTPIEVQRRRRAQYSGRTAVLTLIGDTGRAHQASAQVNPQAVALQHEVLGIAARS